MSVDKVNNTEDLLYKLIFQFAKYTTGSNKQLDPYLLQINQHFKQGLTYQKLTPELIALSKSFTHLSNIPFTSASPSTPLQLKKEFIERFNQLFIKTEIPLKYKNKYLLFKQKASSILDDINAEATIELALSLIIDIKDHAIFEHHEIEGFLREVSSQFNNLSGRTLSVSNANNQSIQDSKILNNAINIQVSKIKSSSATATNLMSLQENINVHLQELSSELIKHKRIDTDNRSKTNQQLEKMSREMHDLEIEVDSLRNNLKAVRNKALHDALTGLANRTAYDERSIIEYDRWSRYKSHLVLIMWDIDLFKAINDTFGHKAGDKTLSLVAQILSGNCRKSDFIARIGGEEFVTLLPSTNSNGALEIAEKIRKIISNSRFNHQGNEIKLTISAGISEFSDNDTLESVFERADKALYQSKEQGRNRCTIINN